MIRRSIHRVVRWEMTVQPKHLGGFSMRNLEILNKECIMKLGWKLLKNSNELWCLLLKGLYKDTDIHNPPRRRSSDSGVQKAIFQTILQFFETGLWSLRDGTITKVLEYCWIELGV